MPLSVPSPLKLEVTPKLVSAAVDFFYLLERGYGRKASLDMVTSRWGLSKLERAALYRCVFDSKTSAERISKMLARPPEKLAIDGFNVLSTIQSALIGDSLLLAVDGFIRDLSASIRRVAVNQLLAVALNVLLSTLSRFNVLSTIQSALIGDSLLLAVDGFIRDLSASIRRVAVNQLLAVALNILLSTLSRLNVKEAIIIFDAQVSKSGEFARMARVLVARALGSGDVLVSSKADTSLATLSGDYVVATSDSLLVDRVRAVFDVGGFVCSALAADKIINFKEIIEEEVNQVAAHLAKGFRTHDA